MVFPTSLPYGSSLYEVNGIIPKKSKHFKELSAESELTGSRCIALVLKEHVVDSEKISEVLFQ